MVRLIALDLDGTLLHTDKGLTNKTKDILLTYIQQGTHVVIASGRSYASLPRDIMSVPGIEYVITSNGVAVCRKSTGEKIFYTPLQPDCVQQLLQLIEETGAVFEIFLDGVPYANADYVDNPTKYGASAHSIPYIQRTRRPVTDLMSFTQKHIQELDCIDLITVNPKEKQFLLQKLQVISGLYITSSVPYLVEISDASAGKGPAVQKLATYLNIPPEEIAAFGNAENDMDMMEFAGIGVAVANSPQNVRDSADYVTLSNDEDGVAVFLEKLLHNKAGF